MTPAKVSTVIIFTTQMTQLAEFYRLAFDLQPPQATGEDHLGFQLPGLYLGFDQVPAALGQGTSAVSLWFDVTDLEVTYRRLLDLGAAIRYAPQRKPWGGFLACVYDPDGNMIGLSQLQEQSGDQ